MNNTVKKNLNISLKICTCFLAAFAIFMMVFTVVTVTTVDRNDRSLFGIKFYIVQTDSMKLSENNADLDVHFSSGDIVVIKKVKDFKSLQPGDVIAFVSMNTESQGETVTHMIRNVVEKNGKLEGFVTYGTNTGVTDEALVEPEYVLGQYTGKLPGVGRFFAYIKTTPGYVVCILIPFLLLIFFNGFNATRLFRRYKREQMEALQVEKGKIEEERAENQRMMQELLSLKAQLDAQISGSAPLEASASEEDHPTQKDSEKTSENMSAVNKTDE